MRYRTFIHKDCDREVFGPLFAQFPKNRKVGSNKHEFFSSTLQQLSDLGGYERDSLVKSEMSGQEMYDYIYLRIGTEGYLGAIETTEAQAGLVQDYCNTLAKEPV